MTAIPVTITRRADRPAGILTARQLEDHLVESLRELTPADLPTIAAARAVRASIRGRYGFKATSAALLTPPDGNEKARKGRGLPVWTLSLAPAVSSGLAELCAHRGACTAPCVAHAGNGGFPASVRARQARTALLLEAPAAFLAMLIYELDAATADGKRRRNSRGAAVRLNTFSDLRWERIMPPWFWARYSRARFYDYTKHPASSRPAATLPRNYRLSYSIHERTTTREVTHQVAAGRSVVVVLETRGGTDRATGKPRPIPAAVAATIAAAGSPMIDGDADDRRYLDPAGAIVVLRRKGTLRAADPLVVGSDRLAGLLALV